MSTMVLALFTISIVLFQISCQRTATAQTNSGASSINKILFAKSSGTGGSGTRVQELWTANYDGTGAVKINITLPTGVFIADAMNARLSVNGQKIFFEAGPPYQTGATTSTNNDIYSCNIDGSGVIKIVDKGTATAASTNLMGAY